MIVRKLKYLCAATILLFVACNLSYGQNTKGDQPQSGRETRFKKSDRKVKSSKRVQSRRASSNLRAYRPRKESKGGERAGRPLKPVYSSRPGRSERQNVYSKNNRYYNDNKATEPRNNQRPQSNRATLARLRNLQSDRRPGNRARVSPRSASRSYIARKSINLQARYRRPQKRGERATTRDIAGRKIRGRNYESPRPGITPAPSGRRYSVTARQQRRNQRENTGGRYGQFRNFSSSGGRRFSGRTTRIIPRSASRSGSNVYSQSDGFVSVYKKSPPRRRDKPVSNRSTLAKLKRLQGPPPREGGRKVSVIPASASRPFLARKSPNTWAHFPRGRKKGERAVTTDIAGRPLRTRNYQSPRIGLVLPTGPYKGKNRGLAPDRAYRGAGGGYSSATRTGERSWRGDIANRKVRGIKKPRFGDFAFSGRKKGYRSISGRNRIATGPNPVKAPGIGANGIERYRGNQTPGKVLNDQGEEFTGAIKRRRPAKGGGSVSGRLWNNNGTAIQGRAPGIGADNIGGFQGNIKIRPQKKGGGSVSGRLWNNDGRAISGRVPPKSAAAVAGFPGKMKRFANQPGYQDQGEEFTGYIKIRKPAKGGGSVSGKLWNNDEKPIAVRTPKSNEADGLQIKVKRRPYVKNDNSAELALLKLKPTEATKRAGGLQIAVKRRDYVKNPNSAEGSLLKLKPTEATKRAGDLQVRVKQYHYIRNKSSADDALRVREPGRAFARATDYQGNIKMRKFTLFEKNRELHPDARFVKINKNNVAEEKDALTNFKLWWSRLFRKNETQPENLKDKGRKPRYDKGEQGLWYE